MRERVEGLVGPRAKAMWVMTFHSACVRILRREATKVGLKSSFSIYDAADSQRLMALVLRDLDLDPKRYNPRRGPRSRRACWRRHTRCISGGSGRPMPSTSTT